uniref:EOG090X03A4 n=1 Tax=Evadne anonyx TaxID=141404 RepID=A0A9N6WTA8_9CRUS|nr:EOG090X03A4 [Evadne anonyx]
MMKYWWFIIFLLFPATLGQFNFPSKKDSASASASSSTIADRCFCELKGNVDECECSVDFVDTFNNYRIYPRTKRLLSKNYFRFYKVNLKKPCPYWEDEGGCVLKSCAVESCPAENMPAGLYTPRQSVFFGPVNDPKKIEETCASNDQLGYINTTLTKQMSADLARWTFHDENLNSFCDIDDEESNQSVFVDLFLNPERFTGYKGPSAQRIWKSIYEENCFKPGRGYGPYIDSTNVGDLCLEKRAFYRAISGLHTSINVHLCSEYLLSKGGVSSLEKSRWGPNPEEFQRRFDPELTNGEGPQRLRNLYFLYLLELRALAKAAPFIEQLDFYTGNAVEDAEVYAAVHDLLHHVKTFKPHFNETSMFNGDRHAEKLKAEFRHHFRNITQIMDCVGCEKCKLWGKLQTQGLGTALKILFSGTFDEADPTAFDLASMKKTHFKLTRNEIVSLFNAFGRLAHSIYSLEDFRQLAKS